MVQQTIPEGIKPGLKGEAATLVCKHNVAPHVQMFGTPAMTELMEMASVYAIQVHLDKGQTSVGFEVHIRHLAPAPIGRTVRAVAELLEIQGNKLLFKVEAFDGEKKLGEGTHRRAFVMSSFGKG